MEHNELCHEVIRNLRQCGHFLYFKTGGKTGRRRIFYFLLQRGELPQRELQDLLCVQSGSLSEIIIKMEADGLIEKVRSRRDGRRLVLQLTAEGRRQAEESCRKYERQVEKMLSCLSPDQKTALLDTLELLIAHWAVLDTDEDFLSPGGEESLPYGRKGRLDKAPTTETKEDRP